MEDKRSLTQVGKVPIFKPRVGIVFFWQTIGGKNVISPYYYTLESQIFR